MAIGECCYLSCRSVIGSTFRSHFWQQSGEQIWVETLLCPTHERVCRPIRDGEEVGKLMISPEGWVYVSFWMDALGFR